MTKLFVGARENTAIVEDSPDGFVRYRGEPKFTPEDARLFAAAADLLAALRQFVERYTAMVHSGDCGNWDPETDAEVIAARAAIARAEGL